MTARYKPKSIRVLIVDDHLVVRKGVALCLTRSKHIKVVGDLGDAHELILMARERCADVVLMDIELPGASGLMLTRLLREQLPGIKVVILSIHEDPEWITQAVQAGANGYLNKGASAEDLIHAVESVYRGEEYLSTAGGRAAIWKSNQEDAEPEESQLTEREREVLAQIAQGASNKEIAARFGISVRTIESHREHIMNKLNIHSVAGLTRFALARSMVPLENDPDQGRRPSQGGNS